MKPWGLALDQWLDPFQQWKSTGNVAQRRRRSAIVMRTRNYRHLPIRSISCIHSFYELFICFLYKLHICRAEKISQLRKLVNRQKILTFNNTYVIHLSSKKHQKLIDFSFSNGICFVYMILNWSSLGFGLLVRQNRISEEIILDHGKLWWPFFTILPFSDV